MTLEAPTTTTEIVVLDPVTGSVASTTAVATPEQVRDAVSRARAAFDTWSTTAPADRGALLRTAAEHLRAHADELAELNTRETGKVPGDAIGGVEAGIGTLLQYAELGPLHRGEALRGQHGAADWTIPHPRGVVLALTPWNDPVAVALGILGAAVVTGNTVVHKGSERCPATIARLNALLAEVLPDGVLVGVDGDASTGEALLAEDGIAVYAHVGSTATGDRLAQVATGTRAHVIRENGGNDPIVVDADVDPDVGGGPGSVGGVREHRTDLHECRARVRAPRDRRRLRRGARRGGRAPHRAAGGRVRPARRRAAARSRPAARRRRRRARGVGPHRRQRARGHRHVLPGDGPDRRAGRRPRPDRGDLRADRPRPRRRLVRRGTPPGRRRPLRVGRHRADERHRRGAPCGGDAAGRHGQGQRRVRRCARRQRRTARRVGVRLRLRPAPARRDDDDHGRAPRGGDRAQRRRAPRPHPPRAAAAAHTPSAPDTAAAEGYDR